MNTLWNKDQEKDFFNNALSLASPEKLFYLTKDGNYYAYWPKKYKGNKTTLQSRNSFIGSYTEKYTSELFEEISGKLNCYSVQGIICDEIGLTKNSRADVAICKTNNIIQKAEDIRLILEVKMSVVWNWQYKQFKDSYELTNIGDYKSHQGTPGLLRSDTMLKAIGKSINIRVSGFDGSKIPIIIIGNTPITKSYYKKVDHLKKCGVIQGFWSVNHKPIDNPIDNIKRTEEYGFFRFDDLNEFNQATIDIVQEDREYFSSMLKRKRLGEIIEIANRESSYEKKAQSFLELLKKQ